MEKRLEFQVCVPSTERLDRFLADQLSISRTQAARLVAAGSVFVNGERARPSRTLDREDLVVVEVANSTPSQPRHLAPHDAPVAVAYEDDVLMVLDKPAGLVVHPAPGHWDDTLLNVLVARGTELAGGAEGRPGIVHRLDKDTSGLLVLAKTDSAHRKLARAMGRRQVERVYATLAWGHLSGPTEVEAPIGRHPQDRKRMTVLATGRPSLTHLEVVARFGTCDLLRVRLGTGRTHQIRVHLHHIGHPIVGDPVYGGGGYKRMTGAQQAEALRVERAAPRQALHAASLSIGHPETGERRTFRSEWPQDLRASLREASQDPGLLDRKNVLEYLGFFE